jgi:hypothetical protein
LRAWRTACASAVGTSHARTGAPCQDAARCTVLQAPDGGEILLACVADGAGSAAQSEAGANLVVDAFLQRFASVARQDAALAFCDRAAALAWLADTQADIADRAAAAGLHPDDYACTFLGAIVGEQAAAFIQIGDGAIVYGPGRMAEHDHVFWPQHGEYANSTFFVTMANAAEIVQFRRCDAAINELAIFSDGLERLVLDMTARTVHSPALRPIFGWLAGTAPGAGDHASAVIAAYLNSPNVNRRTDDDKTLVMATRAPHPPDPAPQDPPA